MTQVEQSVERMLSAKEISAELLRRYGISRTESYICAIRRYTENRGECLFVNRVARASDVYHWLERNKRFSRAMANRRSVPQIGVL